MKTAFIFALALVGILGLGTTRADDEPVSEDKPAATKPIVSATADEGAAKEKAAEAAKVAAAASESKPKYPPHAVLLKDAEKVSGLVPLYRKDGKVYAELTSNLMNKDFIVLISIAKGIGREPVLGGMSWSIGDDWIWQFRKVDDSIHVVRRNVRFTATKGSPEERAVGLAYTDSVLFSLPIATMGPSGGPVVDLNQIFMTDLPQISQELPGFMFASNRSTWAAVKGFPDNAELEVAATYASSGTMDIDTIADTRGTTINVHYSISLLPQTGYRPRLADDRVGYFLTVLKDYSKQGSDDRFVRYINRWDLSKADSSAEMSPPKKPIIFWLEKTVPYKYRAPIRDGILEWNKAFEKAGYVNAIEVRQQPDNADWDPEDINYNTFRWITSSPLQFGAMGPSRVNPLTGQILDADIIFDADFLQYWKAEYETFTPAGAAVAMSGDPELTARMEHERMHQSGRIDRCMLHDGMSRELALGTTLFMIQTDKTSGPELEKMIMQGIKETTMHEVGHTLGLRHNFKASTLYDLVDLNDTTKTSKTGLAASVMDYAPTQLAPKGTTQGDYFSTTIGPYDMWVIEYGYKPLSGSTDSDVTELKKIATRAAEKGLDYGSDEDTADEMSGRFASDPLTGAFDLGKDPLAFAKQRAQLITELWPGLVDRVIKEGEGYQRARRAFRVLLDSYGGAMRFAARHIGGVYVHRDHKGDPNARAPFVVVEPAKQREALKLLEEQLFNDKPFQFPPELYNHLMASRWYHWGYEMPTRTDYPIHQAIQLWQDRVLDIVLSAQTLSRLHDSELKVPADQEAFTVAELIQGLTKTIYSETESINSGEFTTRKPAISSLRRGLQRNYLKRVSQLALGRNGVPQDCQTIAHSELKRLKERIDKLLGSDVKLDDYSKAHLEETSSRIAKVLEAQLQLPSPFEPTGIIQLRRVSK